MIRISFSRKMSTWAMNIFGLVVVFQASYVMPQPSTCGVTQWPTGRSSGYLSSPKNNGVGGFTTSSPIGIFDMQRYPSNTDCVYDVTATRGTGIKFKWENFDVTGDMPHCTTDYVEVFIGCSRTSIGRLCSNNLKAGMDKTFDIYSPDSCLRIVFHSSNNNSNGKGFRALISTYNTRNRMRPYECTTRSYGFLKTAYYNTFSSPYWPQPYPVKYSSSCYFKLDIGFNYHAKLVFMDFDLYNSRSCDRTKMKIKGGGSSYSKAHRTIMDSRCGSRKPFTLILTDDKVYVRFKRGENFANDRGFVAGFVVYKPVSGSHASSSSGWPTYIIAVIIIVIVIGVVIFCIYRRRRSQQRANQGVVTSTTYQAAPQQPPPVQGYIPPPTYGQPGGQPYPHPYPQQGIPPPQSSPYQEKQGPYPPPQGYPPPGSQPYPAPDGQTYTPPGGQPYPPPGSQPYPPPGGQPYPTPGSQPYPPPGGQPYPPPGPAPPYPT